MELQSEARASGAMGKREKDRQTSFAVAKEKGPCSPPRLVKESKTSTLKLNATEIYLLYYLKKKFIFYFNKICTKDWMWEDRRKEATGFMERFGGWTLVPSYIPTKK